MIGAAVPRSRACGIGGCSGLDDFEVDPGLLDYVGICPNLTALNAHRLPGVITMGSLKDMLSKLPKLRSLDVHGTEFDQPLVGQSGGDTPVWVTPCGMGKEALEKWRALGRTSPGSEFFDGSGVTPFISPAGCVVR